MRRLTNTGALFVPLAIGLLLASLPCRAENGGTLFGEMLTQEVIDDFRAQGKDQQSGAQPVKKYPDGKPGNKARQTPKQQLAELDRLAAGGYITPQEYKKRKKAILAGM